MRFINTITDEYPVSLNAIKEENPNTSFPETITDETINYLGFAIINDTAKPVYNAYTHKIVEDVPGDDGNQYNQVWLIVVLSTAELEEQLNSALQLKYTEINVYAQGLISNAYANPTQGVTIDPIVQKDRMSFRRNDKSDKLAGEIALTEIEKSEAKTDQKLSEYEMKIWQDADKAITNVNKLDTAEAVNNFDVSAENWNVFIPPPL